MRVLCMVAMVWLAGVIATGSAMPPAGTASDSLAKPQPAQPPTGEHRFGLSQPLPRAKGAIRIAAYNVLNLFDHVNDPALEGEFDDIKMATPHERCVEMAKAIRALDADILALEEVESLDALRWFRDTYLKGMGYTHMASRDVGYYRGVECSLLSRFEITSSTVWPSMSLDDVKRQGVGWEPVPAGAKLTFQRSPLMATVRTPQGYELTIFVVHHKAGREFNYHREAEALKIVELIDRVRTADPSRNIVVMGDFNAAPWDKSLRVYLAAGLIDTMSHRSTAKGDAESPLFKTHESDRVLDYILLNSAAHRELVLGSAFVYGTLTPAATYDFRTDKPPPGYASDHYPVALELRPKDVP